MSALQFIITTAGQTLLSQVGTIGPVTLTKVAIGSSGYTPTAAATALTTQIKQLTPTGSSIPAPGIIHITAQDNSTDVYSVKEVGLYAGTTLFAIYSQTSEILAKAAGNVALFSIDLALTNVPAGSVTIGSATFAYPPATESTQGVAQIATTAQVTAGTDDATIVTPLKLKAGFVRKAGDTMTGLLQLPAMDAVKGGASILLDPNSASSGNAYLQSQGAGYFYLGSYDNASVAIFTNNTVRFQINTDGTIDFRGCFLYNSPSLVPVGCVLPFAMSSIPLSCFLPCNGAAISRTAYAALFANIGTTFGAGNGSTTFNVPDLRGEFIRGYDGGRGVDSGRTFGSWQSDSFASHTHLIAGNASSAGTPRTGDRVLSGSSPDTYFGTTATGGTETRPRNIALTFGIRF